MSLSSDINTVGDGEHKRKLRNTSAASVSLVLLLYKLFLPFSSARMLNHVSVITRYLDHQPMRARVLVKKFYNTF